MVDDPNAVNRGFPCLSRRGPPIFKSSFLVPQFFPKNLMIDATDFSIIRE
jgi:hypothetical protein